LLSEETRKTIRELSSLVPVTILSGRDVEDVRKLVRVDGITYAGSHGFDIIMADGKKREDPRWIAFLPSIDLAETELRAAIKGIWGAKIERKRFAVTMHYRNVKETDVKEMRMHFSRIAASHPKLRKTRGKKVFELLPKVKWNKGLALRFLLKEVFSKKESDMVPVFIGDDLTDEDAFRAIRRAGLGILVVDGEGHHSTLARYSLRNPGEVRAFLENLIEILEGKLAWTLGH
jgi:trehalose 6-phosphate phosphatase